jgi:hypothetical protein
VSERFTLPASAAEACAVLGELGALVTACEWRRAAIIHAMVHVTAHGGDRSKPISGLAKESPDQFARRRIVGLRSAETVRRYVKAWQRACDEGLAEPAVLGEEIDLPDAMFSDYFTPQEPPYFVPSNAAEPLPTDDAHEGDAQATWEERSERDGLGEGDCPPVASDLDQPDGRPPPPPPDRKRRLYRQTLRLALGCLERIEDDAATVLRYAPELNSTDGRRVMKSIARIRQRLNEVERTFKADASGEAEDEP